MANNLLTISMITNEALMVLKNNLTFTRYVTRSYDGHYGIEGAKIGATLNIRKPPRYIGRRGQAMQIEDITEQFVPLVLNTQYGCDIQFSTADLKLSIDNFRERVIVPQIATVANMIDSDGMFLYSQIWNSVGTPGTVPNDMLTYLNAGVKLDNNACPRDGQRALVFSPQMQATEVDALKGLFQSSSKIREQYEEGEMGTSLGFKFSMDQNTVTHTVGTFVGTPLVSGSGQTGTTLVTKGWTAGDTLNVGDIFTCATTRSVNPQSRISTGALMQFVVAAAFTAVGAGGNDNITIAPGIIPAGQFQNVDVSPTDADAIVVWAGAGSSAKQPPQGLAFHKQAFAFATADLPTVGGVDMCARAVDPDLGISMRMIRAYDIKGDQMPCRLDVLGGWVVLRPELACRVAS